MKFVTARLHDDEFIGMIQGEKAIHINKIAKELFQTDIPTNMISFIEHFHYFEHIIKEIIEEKGHDAFSYSIEETEILAPIPRPSKNVFCVGKNYRDHAIEMGSEQDIPTNLMMFSKAPTAVVGPDAPILRHEDVTDELDYEGELAVIIGKKGKSISKDDAFHHVFGYTILNDITARDLQSKHKQFLIGKSLDTSCPMGPFIVHKSEIENAANLHIETRVNGEIRQDGNTEQFIFPIEEIIATLSKGTTLEPGDIIATGTPAGVGKGFNPPKFLSSGDIIEITVEGIGTLRNKVQ